MLDKKKLRELSGHLEAMPDNYMMSFRHNLYMYMEQKGITLQEVAELADISLSTFKSFLYGDSKDCNLSMAVKLARVFDVSVDELIGAGTINPQTCDSLQTIRQLPESFTHFVRWATHFHYDMLKSQKVSERAIEVMKAELNSEGTLKMTNNMEILDISDMDDKMRPKVFMGIKMPSNIYAPHYFEGNILLMANDRPPRNGEHIVICVSGNMWIVEYVEKKNSDGSVGEYYHSIRDERIRPAGEEGELVMGYVVGVHIE